MCHQKKTFLFNFLSTSAITKCWGNWYSLVKIITTVFDTDNDLIKCSPLPLRRWRGVQGIFRQDVGGMWNPSSFTRFHPGDIWGRSSIDICNSKRGTFTFWPSLNWKLKHSNNSESDNISYWFVDCVPDPTGRDLTCVREVPTCEKKDGTKDAFVGLFPSSLCTSKWWASLRALPPSESDLRVSQTTLTPLLGPQEGRAVVMRLDVPKGSQM